MCTDPAFQPTSDGVDDARVFITRIHIERQHPVDLLEEQSVPDVGVQVVGPLVICVGVSQHHAGHIVEILPRVLTVCNLLVGVLV